MNYNADELIDSMMVHYKVNTISQLAKVINVSQPSISAWKKKNYVNAIKKRTMELGIYKDIFENEQIKRLEIIKNLSTEQLIKLISTKTIALEPLEEMVNKIIDARLEKEIEKNKNNNE
ncbi:helix-turn-helix domain-containing protein [Sulfurimonas sp.]|uniref:helix-turn-helix domain-containing protein n=1 Tax=Sulfurimonas sp. TaxID=2022749 RepID=UPI0025E4700E|nr:helix-turn-helix domain-containing protein [Sulfurimonas sp.]